MNNLGEVKPMESLQDWFNAYGESHKHPVNKAVHWVCVPLIFYSILGLLAAIPVPAFLTGLFPTAAIPYVHFGSLAAVLGLVFYFRISWRMALGIMMFCILCLQLAVWVQEQGLSLWQSSLEIFIAAWIGQFYGHKVEGKKPSFFQDLKFLLIGPAWLLGFIYRKMGWRY